MRESFGAVLIAGGEGMRLGYKDGPKALVPIRGIPLVSFGMYALIEAGFAPDTVTTVRNAQTDALERYLRGKSQFLPQKSPLGNADALHIATCEINGNAENVIAIHGDDGFFLAEDPQRIQEIMDEHTRNRADITVVLTPTADKNIHGKRYSVDQDGRVVAVTALNEPRLPFTTSGYFSGVTVFRTQLFNDIFPLIQPFDGKKGPEYGISSVFQLALDPTFKESIGFYGHIWPGFWQGINTQEDLQRVETHMRSTHVAEKIVGINGFRRSS
ncbi:NDP-sugar synthase [Candidatus Woesebacteria bacterium]|jgi:NDP-sugar pyrophosphorylase family protein|nr:NDP-sugar synthase [Candidatus Woesebacteria bacterium]